jgi:pSer/pThr/pTyr-binding forkhead associated (FHA) protein
LYLLANSSCLRALEADLITFGAAVALVAAAAGLLNTRREVATVLAAIAGAGFVAAAVGVIWTLVESQNVAFRWGVWGVDIDRGLGLVLFLVAALVGAILVAVGFVVGPVPVAGGASLPAQGGPEEATPARIARIEELVPATGAAVAPAMAPGSPEVELSADVASGAAGRITVVESGRSSTLSVGEGERVIVGRDLGADIRVTDAKVSRRHAMIEWSAGGWIVRDLAATNPTRFLDASGGAQILAGQIRIASGQLVMGDVLITLNPAGG